MKRFKKAKKAFTLIELMVVLAIIAILATLAAPAIVKNIKKATFSKANSTLEAFYKNMLSFAAKPIDPDADYKAGTENVYKKNNLVFRKVSDDSIVVGNYLSDIQDSTGKTLGEILTDYNEINWKKVGINEYTVGDNPTITKATDKGMYVLVDVNGDTIEEQVLAYCVKNKALKEVDDYSEMIAKAKKLVNGDSSVIDNVASISDFTCLVKAMPITE